MDDLLVHATTGSTPIHLLTPQTIVGLRETLTEPQQAWCDTNHFEAKPKQICCLPDDKGQLSQVLYGLPENINMWDAAALATRLLPGCYHLIKPANIDDTLWWNMHLAWGMAGYRFSRYKSSNASEVELAVDSKLDLSLLQDWIESLCLGRDLINTPCEDMTPQDLAASCQALAKQYKAKIDIIEGKALLKKGFPTIHAVGRASVNEPCLIDLTWGDHDGPAITLVGKGVCFDTGGLDIKTTAGMRYMKKDMGGAACAIALARMIMQRNLQVNLRLLIPAVENSVAGDAIRPGDVVKTRSGLTVEITNTDAEGRLVLCDALTYAGERHTDYLFDFATLTGAARVALGPRVAAMYCNNDDMADKLQYLGTQWEAHAWRMPLFDEYNLMLKSTVANIVNSANTAFAGSITAALYLQQFIPEETKWAHYDVYGWNPKTQPGRPEGADIQVVKGVFAYIHSLLN